MAVTLPGTAVAQGIYTCVDAKGRRITSDRPNIECLDRAQQEISSSGTIKRVLGPSLTAQERKVLEEKERLDAQERSRDAEEKRRNRALMLRYPNRAVHDKERSLALAQVHQVIASAFQRMHDLAAQRKPINLELEFYKNDLTLAPAALRRKVEENDGNMLVQRRFIDDQDVEKRRVNGRFDEELVKLTQLWIMTGVTQSAATASADAASAAAGTAAKY